MSIITLTTDFGISDPYVGLMKGVILSIAPDATIVDITHNIPPQDVLVGSLMIESIVGYFPQDTIHLAVIDPGVGSQRQAVAIRSEKYFYVGPDNGLFSAALQLDPMLQAVALTNTQFHLQPTSHTFHGRDIFAPVAAHLANGTPLKEFGPAVSKLTTLDVVQPRPAGANVLELCILRIDHFGNLITNLSQSHYQHWQGASGDDHVTIEIAGWRIAGIANTFASVQSGQAVAYFGSTGHLEIGVRDGSAMALFNADENTPVTLSRFR